MSKGIRLPIKKFHLNIIIIIFSFILLYLYLERNYTLHENQILKQIIEDKKFKITHQKQKYKYLTKSFIQCKQQNEILFNKTEKLIKFIRKFKSKNKKSKLKEITINDKNYSNKIIENITIKKNFSSKILGIWIIKIFIIIYLIF